MSMFSTLNNLQDISLRLNAGTLVGYTESEIRTYFCNHINALKAELSIEEDEDLMAKLRDAYNGYTLGLSTSNGKVSESIYNPFAINYAFNSLDLEDKWSLSGSASMLSDKLVEAEYHYHSLLSTNIDKLMTSYKPSDMSLTSLMYYGGYATIGSFDKQSRQEILKIPNNESVKRSLAQDYLESIFSKAGLVGFDIKISTIYDLLVNTPNMCGSIGSLYHIKVILPY